MPSVSDLGTPMVEDAEHIAAVRFGSDPDES